MRNVGARNMKTTQTIIFKRVSPLGWGIVNIPTALLFAISFLNAILPDESKSHPGHLVSLLFVTCFIFALFCLMASLFNFWLRIVRYPLTCEVEINANTDDFFTDLKNRNQQRDRKRLESLNFRVTGQSSPSANKDKQPISKTKFDTRKQTDMPK